MLIPLHLKWCICEVIIRLTSGQQNVHVVSGQWEALSLWEPVVESELCSGLWRCLSVVSRSCFHHDSCVFLPTVASVTVWTHRQWKPHFSSLSLLYSAWKFCSWKRCTSAWRRKMESEWVVHCLQFVDFVSFCLLESVSPHMVLFLAVGNCALVCVLAGVGIWRRAPEKTGCLLSWKENIAQHNRSFVLQRERW